MIKKKYLMILSVAIVSVLLGSLLYSNVTLAPKGELLSNPVFPGSASFIIGTDGTNIWAVNGTTGQIVYFGTNATQVIQNAIDALTNGGEIFIRSGTYIVADTEYGIRVSSDTSIIGEGYSTCLKTVDGARTIDQIITNADWEDGNVNIEIAHLQLDGNKENFMGYGRGARGRGIYFVNASYSFFHHLWVHHTAGRGIGGLNAEFVTVADNDITACGRCGIELQNVDHAVCCRNKVYKNVRHGIRVENSADGIFMGNIVYENDVDDTAMYDGMYFLGYSRRDVIIGNRIQHNDRYEINIDSHKCFGTIIKDNIVMSCKHKEAIMFNPDADIVIRGNRGFVTENSGKARVADNECIRHRLDSSLNIGKSNSTVLITLCTVTYKGHLVIVGCNNVNSTHIQVAVFWAHNETAITDDKVDIWWSVEYR